MKAFILGIIVALACVAVAVYIYFATGMAPVATSAQAMPFEKALASKALHARAQKEMPKNPSMQPTEADYTAAAHEYVEHCALCHGVPGKDATAIADGMFPIFMNPERFELFEPHLEAGFAKAANAVGHPGNKTPNGVRTALSHFAARSPPWDSLGGSL